MEPLTLTQLAEATGGSVLKGAPELLIRDITTDTREDCRDRLYVPLKGEKFDGHRFIKDAVKKGAVGCVASQEPRRTPNGFAVVYVRDTLKAYQAMGSYNRRVCNGPVVAITGSCGKTTTKNMMRNVLARRWNVVATEKNENNEIGVPRTLLRADRTTGAVVLEMGMRGPGEIRELAQISAPDVALITNVEKTHIGRLGSEEGIAKAKGELIEELDASRPAFLNADNPWTLWLAKRTRADVITFGIQSGHVRASRIACDMQGISFTIHGIGNPFSVRLPLMGRANIYNALSVAAVGAFLGLNKEDIRGGLFQDISEQGRLRRLETQNGSQIIDDTYNSNPSSLAFALQLLAELPWSGRRVAVLGDMLELGDYEQNEHFNIGKQHVVNNCDLLITLGQASENIYEGALESGMDPDMAVHFEKFALLKRRAASLFAPGDLILVKGSRGAKMERVVDLLTGGKI